MTRTFKDWLEEIGLERYESLFLDNDIDYDTIFELTEQDLKDLNISLGHRKRFMRAIAKAARDSRDDRADGQSAERRQLTIFFCDLVDSTALSARMELEQYRKIIKAFHACCEDGVHRFNGNIARVMGDAVLVYFGYPTGDEHAPENAVRAARSIIASLTDISEPDDPPMSARIGISTGAVVVGDLIGTGPSEERLVVGETPNMAKRLQEIAEPNQIVVSEATRRLAGGLFEYKDLGLHRLKGFDTPLAAWAVTSEIRVDSRFDATRRGDRVSDLVGRDDELGLLAESWDSSAHGRLQLSLIVGEAGIGKSRLLLAFREYLRNLAHFEVHFACGPRDQDRALLPVANYFERLSGVVSSDEPQIRFAKLESMLRDYFDDLKVVAPLFASLLSLPLTDSYEPLALGPRLRKEKLFAAIAEYLTVLTHRQPVLVTFEDLQWVDSATLDFLNQLVDSEAARGILVVATARPSFSMRWSQECCSIVHLDRLATPEAMQIVFEVCGEVKLPPELASLVIEKADGVPLFVEELTKTVIDSCRLDERAQRYVLVGELADVSIPSTLHDSLIARLDRLGRAREIAQLGAVIGRQFPYRLLASVCHKPEADLQDDLNRLTDSNLITVSGYPPDSLYRFRHALIQDAAYATLLRGERTRLHGMIATALEALRKMLNARPELIAYHFSRADNQPRAIEYWLEAGMQARERAAHSEAVQHLNTGLTKLQSVDEAARDRLELELRIQLGLNLEAAGGYADSKVAENYARASDLCERLGETSESVPVLLGHYVFRLVRADYSMARELATQCVELAERSGNSDHLIESYAALGHVLPQMGELAESVPALLRCIELSRRRNEAPLAQITAQDPEIASLGQLAIVTWLIGKPDRALVYIEEAFARQAKLGHPINEAMICPYASMVHALRSEWQLSQSYAERGMTKAHEYGYDYWLLLNQAHYGVAVASLGSFAQGYENFSEATLKLKASAANASLSYFCAVMAQAAIEAQEWSTAVALVADAIEQAEKHGEGFVSPLLYIVRARTKLRPKFSDTAAAAMDLSRSIALAKDQGATSFALQAELERYSLHVSERDDRECRKELRLALDAIEGGESTRVVRESVRLLGAA